MSHFCSSRPPSEGPGSDLRGGDPESGGGRGSEEAAAVGQIRCD